MSLATLWLVLLGLLLAGYFVLGGYDYGAQMLHRRLNRATPDGRVRTAAPSTPGAGPPGAPGRTGASGHRPGAGRNAALDAVAPYFLGNEVWLVAFTGVLFGAFPYWEGSLLSGLYPLIVTILVGLVLGGAAVQLRGRSDDARARRRWDALIVFGGAVPAVGWGLVLGLLLSGVPRRPDGSFHIGAGDVLAPFVLACGATTALLFAAHGAAFVALRAAPGPAEAARRTAAALLPWAGATALAALLLTLAGAGPAMTNPGPSAMIAALFAAALALARGFLAAGRPGRAFAATACATALPVPLVGAGHHPYVLITPAGDGMTVDQAVTDDATLHLLTGFGAVLIPVILGYQAWSWWTFRGRTGRRHPHYF
ncbi:cytochrome d ubiquinol oxidase subunit II [Streptomyces sp. NPDC058953]|uniref:cytochrome d ubiquinol oxidase subunit II n=1 Tax=unclassified Streptomyces TaxID=2593676 RepID=UPI0036D0256D